MNNLDVAKDILEKLRLDNWKWSSHIVEDHIAQIASSLGYKLDDRTDTRISFGAMEDIDFSIYVNKENHHVVSSVEITLDAFFETDERSYDELEKKEAEFYQRFRQLVPYAEKLFGSAHFQGTYTSPGYPQGYDALWLSLWLFGSIHLSIQVEHQDKELPIRLCIVLNNPDFL